MDSPQGAAADRLKALRTIGLGLPGGEQLCRSGRQGSQGSRGESHPLTLGSTRRGALRRLPPQAVKGLGWDRRWTCLRRPLVGSGTSWTPETLAAIPQPCGGLESIAPSVRPAPRSRQEHRATGVECNARRRVTGGPEEKSIGADVREITTSERWSSWGESAVISLYGVLNCCGRHDRWVGSGDRAAA